MVNTVLCVLLQLAAVILGNQLLVLHLFNFTEYTDWNNVCISALWFSFNT